MNNQYKSFKKHSQIHKLYTWYSYPNTYYISSVCFIQTSNLQLCI